MRTFVRDKQQQAVRKTQSAERSEAVGGVCVYPEHERSREESAECLCNGLRGLRVFVLTAHQYSPSAPSALGVS